MIIVTHTAALGASAEIVFQDFFNGPAGNLTNSVPWIDVQGNGWQTGAGAAQLLLDGNQHVYNGSASADAAAGAALVPIGPHGSLTASAWVQLPVGSAEWVGLGFAGSNSLLSASDASSAQARSHRRTRTASNFGNSQTPERSKGANAFQLKKLSRWHSRRLMPIVEVDLHTFTPISHSFLRSVVGGS